MRKIIYVSGTRADFGLMAKSLGELDRAPDVNLSVLVTGMHLASAFGKTVNEIEASGVQICGRITTKLTPPTGATIARSIADMISGMTQVFQAKRPDLVLVLGDRPEMLAAAISAIYLNIPIAHIHGGERSGTVDEPVRHAITKLAHIHLVATSQSRDRLISMGEVPSNIHIIGAPGLDDIHQLACIDKAALWDKYKLRSDCPTGLLVFHPVLQESNQSADQTEALLSAMIGAGLQVVALMPNSDAGSDGVRSVLENCKDAKFYTAVHMPRTEFLSFLKHADILAGNSSAGIIEAASFGIPVLNVGNRQNYRERNANVTDVPAEKNLIGPALAKLMVAKRFPTTNIYGDGKAYQRLCKLLPSVNLDENLLNKVMEY